MELRDLCYFCAVIETGNVTKAAGKLGSSQPFLTKVIRQLEAELGAPLFKKSGRYIEPTEFGRAFYTQAKKVLVDMDNLYAEVDHLLDRQGRTITLLTNTEAYTPGLILNLNKSRLSYSIAALYASRDEILAALCSDEDVCALCCPPIPADISSGIVTENAFYDTGRVLLPPGHPLLEKKIISVSDLRGEHLVASPRGSALRCVVEPVYEAYGMDMNIICESNNLHVISRAVENGLGYALIPRSYLNEQPDLYRRCVDIDVPPKINRVFFALSYNRSLAENRNFKDFRAFALQYFADFQKSQDKLGKMAELQK